MQCQKTLKSYANPSHCCVFGSTTYLVLGFFLLCIRPSTEVWYDKDYGGLSQNMTSAGPLANLLRPLEVSLAVSVVLMPHFWQTAAKLLCTIVGGM